MCLGDWGQTVHVWTSAGSVEFAEATIDVEASGAEADDLRCVAGAFGVLDIDAELALLVLDGLTANGEDGGVDFF